MVRDGPKPFRPPDNPWLQDPVWDVITAGWSREPKERCDVLSMHRAFLTASRHPDHSFGTGESSGTLTIEKGPLAGTGREQRGRLLPRIASFFQFLRDSEPEVQKRVNEMDEVIFSTAPSTLPRS